MVDVADLGEYVNASASDEEFLSWCLSAAVSMVSAYVGESPIPAAVLDIAQLQVASELFNRRQAPNGIAQFSTFDGAPIRVARDPMTSTYPLLNKFITWGV